MKMPLFILALFLTACHSGMSSFSDSKDEVVQNGGGQTGDGSQAAPSSAPSPAPEFFKGMTLVCWYPGCYQVSEIDSELNFLESLGVDSLAIVPTWYQSSATASDIAPDEDRTPTDEDIRFIVRLAKERGLKILLKPHVDISGGGWRGGIDPADVVLWRSRYRGFILHFAGLARELNVEIFSVGTELKRRSPDLSFWQSLIGEVRNIYRGKVTYAANWDEYESVGFWAALDFIGIDFYRPIASGFFPTQADMESNLRAVGLELAALSRQHGKPVLFTEIGYRSVDGAARRPYDFSMTGRVDLQEQADSYSAVLTAYANTGWLAGIFWWREDPGVLGGADDDDYFIYGKPAADVLRRFWRGE